MGKKDFGYSVKKYYKKIKLLIIIKIKTILKNNAFVLKKDLICDQTINNFSR